MLFSCIVSSFTTASIFIVSDTCSGGSRERTTQSRLLWSPSSCPFEDVDQDKKKGKSLEMKNRTR
ncbi:hypothetical protein GLYMA_03G044250v4 [Glycine max]|nr:hypothetical protein GLYMA_03G044250v4 [Glycine max]